jgi:hypothetical protein
MNTHEFPAHFNLNRRVTEGDLCAQLCSNSLETVSQACFHSETSSLNIGAMTVPLNTYRGSYRNVMKFQEFEVISTVA